MPKPVIKLNPPSVAPPQGAYSHVARVEAGELAFIAGQVAVDEKGNLVGRDDFAAQVNAVFANLERILKDLGTDFSAVAEFTTYIVGQQNLEAWFKARTEIFKRIFADGGYPPNTLLIISGLVKPEFKLEISAVARLPG